MVVRMRATRSHRNNRRSHHALAARRPAKCECGAIKLPHTACPSCGKYRGRVVIDVVKRTERAQKRLKRKQEEARAEGRDAKGEKKETAKA